MTNKDFFLALDALEQEKGISEEVFITALEQALTAAYKKNSGMAKNAQVKLNPEKNTIKIYSYRTIVETVEDSEKEISLEDARQIKKSYKLGDMVMAITGVWENTVGNIKSINEGKQTVTIMVDMFGRETPVELGFAEIRHM